MLLNLASQIGSMTCLIHCCTNLSQIQGIPSGLVFPFGFGMSLRLTLLGVETAIQLTLTELNENLREIYIEAYSLPDTSEYIYLHTTAELKQIFGENFPDDTESDFYEMEIGTAGLMRSYMARKCDIHFPLERKLSRFLTAAMRVYRIPEEEQAKVLAFIQSLDIEAIATEVMYKLFAMLEMKYDFKLSKDSKGKERKLYE